MFRLLIFILGLLFLASCVSTYTALQDIQPGLSKQRVRNTIGKPVSVGRLDSMDRWTYKFKWHSQEYTQDVLFDEGKVQKLGPLTHYPNYEKKMIDAESLEEYEMNATLYQKQRQAGFREINTLNTGSNIPNFCSNRFSGSTVLNCQNIITGKKFIPSALKFCDNKIGNAHTKLQCLKIISNKKFSRFALTFCDRKISNAHTKLQCLKIISNKKFNNSALKFCDESTSDSDMKLKCLKNLGNTII